MDQSILWERLLTILNDIFDNEELKIIICLGTIKYVPINERDKIFQQMHASPIGGHKGVSKTYNRIKHN